MKPWARWIHVITAIAVAVVAVSSIVQAIRQGSWAPLIAVGWLPAVAAATWWPARVAGPGPAARARPGKRPAGAAR
jgi:hypothetical protein